MTNRARENGGAAAGLLHNSGPCTREVFRTPMLGVRVRFDLTSTLSAWGDWDGDAAAGAELREASAALSPGLIENAATRALDLLGCGAKVPGRSRWRLGADDRTCTLLASLALSLRESGALRDMVGLAAHENARGDRPFRLLLPDTNASVVRVATTLVAYAVYAPPLLLWTRAPTLRWFRTDVIIWLRRFGSPARHDEVGA